MQLQTMNSPFDQEQVELINRLLPMLTDNQKIWLNGYLAGSQSAATVAVQEQPGLEWYAQQGSAPVATREITILVGSHTGNCQSVAKDVSKKLQAKDYQVKLTPMDEFKPKDLKKVQDLLIITSTHGDGHPPDNALALYDFLHSKRAPQLDDVRFSVLSLGDSSYEFFCQTGKDFDKRLEELGAKRIHPRVDADLDFEEPAEEWFDGIFSVLNKERETDRPGAPAASAAQEAAPASQPAYSRSNPFNAEVLENINLNGRGSNKETRHLELDLEGSGLQYEPGDSLGIVPENEDKLVDQLIAATGWNPDEPISINKQGDTGSLRDALISTFEITILSKPLLEKAAAFADGDALANLLEPENKEQLQAYIYGRDLIDLTEDFGPWQVSAAEFIKILRKIPVRLYSIASSLTANPDEVHLTVGALRYEANGRKRTGVCSTQCAERAEIGATLPVFIQSNSNFRLPENPETPVIMIGAGTGVAPYRAFMEEREERDALGDAWLFFGEQYFVTDFLYQTEWQKWLKDGVLTKMDVAFSRDTAEKVYVQHRLLEKSQEVYQWLEAGANVYVCGDEKYMAKDVHATLAKILEQEGNMTAEQAEDYLTSMRSDKRYLRDVY
ncbi:assimilatory sulfite reductase (NADPH) flavoprotein subunit [Planococcus sp. ISL-110]|uniref:assimilatory sulfite reductase (NADPH) flavoprotein subunit n=1 Tax=Planococcus sp. ISL-110 TaxID=2819167 RepID=UPI001BE72A0E|nr:assimilatory sulfite reductase (NADPH) flavoprotein subunit [Planococcus sp. ISL-110]MBT2569807.1 assimilatory sulfite reductase (NADPH) flavoprotein subunit [Planococcus sp. ISL-110]